jgi:hypothetical protein
MAGTAVEWLAEQIRKYGIVNEACIEQAKQIEREQIIDAHLKGQREDIDFINEAKQEAEQYYNQTFKSESYQQKMRDKIDYYKNKFKSE